MNQSLTSISVVFCILPLLVVLFQAANMNNNIRNGVRHVQKHALARSSSAQLVRTQSACTSCKGQSQRSIAQSTTYRRAVPFSLNTYSAPHDERDDHVVRMLMFGKPGAGKGTLTTRLAQKYDIITLSTGDLLRQHIAEQTEIGRKAEAIVARGGLVPDAMMLEIVTSKLDGLQNKVSIRTLWFALPDIDPSKNSSIGF